MAAKQADAINVKFDNMKQELENLKKTNAILNHEKDSLKNINDSLKNIKPKADCDSLSSIIREWSYRPSLLYYYNERIHTVDLSLYKIRFTYKGEIIITKLTEKEKSQYHQLLHAGGQNLVDWKQQFIDFDLPLIEDVDKYKSYKK